MALEAVQRLRPLADAGRPDDVPARARLGAAAAPNVAAAIIGATPPEQVHENAAAAGVQLSDDTLRAIDDALDRGRDPLIRTAAAW